ncbi:hypothetical protein HZA39_02240 [Candidatus Peregrinibacteria bacterium]|nr:hypothetical protein [Candidatus Peregrinibacteria bacterium]
MKTKHPTEPIILTEKASGWLEKLLKNNEKRANLTHAEKNLLEGSKHFDEDVKQFIENGV